MSSLHRNISRACGALITAVTLTAGGLAASRPAAAHEFKHSPRIVGIDLTPAPSEVPSATNGFPFLAGKIIPDPQLLDAFARQYARETADPSIREFFLWWLPNRLFDITYGAALPPPDSRMDLDTSNGVERALWLTHVTGWELGIFARRVVDHHLLNAPATNALLTTDLTYMDEARQAAFSYPSAVIAFNLASLRVGGGPPTLQSEDGWYGYDAQFLKEISTVNVPIGFTPLPNWITYTSGTLDATYQIGDAPFLVTARRVYALLPHLGPIVRGRLNDALTMPSSLATYQQGFEAMGHTVWGVLINPIFLHTSYDDFIQNLKLSAYFVQYSQTDTMMALAAYATGDVRLGRREAIAVALFRSYEKMYEIGSGDPNSDSFPDLTSAFAKFRTKP